MNMEYYQKTMIRIRKIIVMTAIFTSAIALSQHGQAADSPPIRGSVGILVGTVPLSETLQYINAKGFGEEPTSESGVGFMLDIGSTSGNAFALDYYVFVEEATRTRTGTTQDDDAQLSSTEKISISGPFLGYRYHYPRGFYLGFGFWYTQAESEKSQQGEQGSTENISTYRPEFLLALNLGYNQVFSSGFTIGAHLLHSFPGTLERDKLQFSDGTGSATNPLSESGELQGLQVTSLSFKLGYSWY